jgi:hypothetical protein
MIIKNEFYIVVFEKNYKNSSSKFFFILLHSKECNKIKVSILYSPLTNINGTFYQSN